MLKLCGFNPLLPMQKSFKDSLSNLIQNSSTIVCLKSTDDTSDSTAVIYVGTTEWRNNYNKCPKMFLETDKDTIVNDKYFANYSENGPLK